MDQREAVSRRYTQHRQEPDDRAQGDDATADERRQHPAADGRRQRQEREHRQAPAPEGRLQQEEDADDGRDADAQHAALDTLALLVLSEDLRAVLERELDPIEAVVDRLHHRAKITP